MDKAPIAVAMDSQDLDRVSNWAEAVAGHVSCAKVGLEVFLRHGRDAVSAVRRAPEGDDLALFLDLKLHDIPNTVAGAARSVADIRPDYLTVHALGGPAVIEAAAEALPDTRITAITVLTSMSEDDLVAVGLEGPAEAAVVRLATLAVDAGARAIVCSPREVAAVRAAVPSSITLITPGVRPTGSQTGDQSRVTTPVQARRSGADLLVIGRPITGAVDPGAAAAAIAAELREAQ